MKIMCVLCKDNTTNVKFIKSLTESSIKPCLTTKLVGFVLFSSSLCEISFKNCEMLMTRVCKIHGKGKRTETHFSIQAPLLQNSETSKFWNLNALYVYFCYVSYIDYAWIFWWIYTVLSTDYIFLLVCDRLLELSWPTYSSDRLMNRLNPGKTLQGTSTDPVRMWTEEVDPSTNLSFSW